MFLNNNSGYNNYHSLELQTTVRPIHGLSGQATYTWSKNLGLPATLTNPTNRAPDYTNINNTPGHSFRANGVRLFQAARVIAAASRAFRRSAGTLCTGPDLRSFFAIRKR